MNLSRRELFRKTAQATTLGVAVLSLAGNTQEITTYEPSTAGASMMVEDLLPATGTVTFKLDDGEIGCLIYTGREWIPCDGRFLPRSSYPVLSDRLSNAYGGTSRLVRIPDTRPTKVILPYD